MSYFTKEQAIDRTNHDIEEMQEVNKALPKIKKVIAKWDGKILNKRLDSDLKAIGLPGYIYLCTSYDNSWEICYRPEKSNQSYCILHGLRPTCRYYEESKSFVNPEKRIKADKAFEDIEAKRVDRLKTIAAYKEHLETWEEKYRQIELLKRELAAITKTIPYTLQDYFNMKVAR